jgi:hypothetical protein
MKKLLLVAAAVMAFATPAMAAEVYRFPTLKPEDKQPLMMRILIDAVVRCGPDHAAAKGKGINAAVKLWALVSEETKKRIETAIDEKIKEVSLEKFCANLEELLNKPSEPRQEATPAPAPAPQATRAGLFTFEQTSVRAQAIPSPQYPNAKMVLVSYILKNNLEQTYKEANIVCSLFIKGQLVGTATKLFVKNIEPMARLHLDAWTTLDVNPDVAECQVQVTH